LPLFPILLCLIKLGRHLRPTGEQQLIYDNAIPSPVIYLGGWAPQLSRALLKIKQNVLKIINRNSFKHIFHTQQKQTLSQGEFGEKSFC
jgi:hypothetical protein